MIIIIKTNNNSEYTYDSFNNINNDIYNDNFNEYYDRHIKENETAFITFCSVEKSTSKNLL